MNYFLEDVARFLYDSNHGDFSNTIIVFPGRRARLFFNKFISGFTDKPLWAPKYFSISDFIIKLSGLQQADQLTLCFRLFKVFKEVTGSQETFDSFYYYCEMMLSDFDDIDKYMVDASVLFSNLQDLKNIDQQFGGLTDSQVEIIKISLTSEVV